MKAGWTGVIILKSGVEQSAQRALDDYRQMRDFSQTPEPSGSEAFQASPEPRFVVQEHHARRLHWDLRLERNGVLASWAIPKGFPPDKKINRLAVRTEDHPLAYLDFQGEIPAGQYGGGQMTIWDQGTYECHEFSEQKVVITLQGSRLQGKYALFQTSGKNWMIHRMDDPAAPYVSAVPTELSPMKAQTGSLPLDDENWAYEIKWDGVRALAYIEGGKVRLQSRNLLNLTKQYPEVAALGKALGETEVVLDGELVALDEKGLPSFERLQQRMGLSNSNDIERMAKLVPITYMIFDLLFLQGRDMTVLPYRERRRYLEDLGLTGPAWQTPGYHVGDGAAMAEATQARGLEGIVAKRLDARYELGRRSPVWKKIKHTRRQEFVVGGWQWGRSVDSSATPREAERGLIGSLLIGYYEGAQLRFAGRVGSGISGADQQKLSGALNSLQRSESPFAEGDVQKEAVYVEPKVVAEVEFYEFTKSGMLRHPVFKGLRYDIDPRDVVREPIA